MRYLKHFKHDMSFIVSLQFLFDCTFNFNIATSKKTLAKLQNVIPKF